jgi:type I restriction enzyme S subunit
MMREYKRYDEYKDSGVEWIGEIPASWDTIKFKYLANIQNGRKQDAVEDLNGEYPILGTGGIMSYSNDFLYDEPSVLLGRKGTINKPKFIEKPFWTVDTLFYTEINNNNILSKLFYYLCKTIPFDYYSTETAIPSMTQNDLSEIVFALDKDKMTQKSIIYFLNNKTAEIDKIIMKKESLIDYLEKYKKSVITEAVTKGKLGDKYINENGELVDEIEMKDSGIEWIEEIPKYWKTIRWKYIIDTLTDYSANGSFADLKSNVTYLDEQDYARLIRLTDLRVDLKNDGIYVNKHAYKYLSKSKLFGGEFLIANVGAYTGHVEKMPNVNYKCTLGPNMFLVRFNNLVTNEFMYYASKSKSIVAQLDLYKNSNASAQPSLNKSDFQSLIFAYPNKSIQRTIIKLLKKKVKIIDLTIENVKKSIEKYKEYKKSLIFDAVTGKIDLRDYELEGGEELAEHNNSSETERERLSAVD